MVSLMHVQVVHKYSHRFVVVLLTQTPQVVIKVDFIYRFIVYFDELDSLFLGHCRNDRPVTLVDVSLIDLLVVIFLTPLMSQNGKLCKTNLV